MSEPENPQRPQPARWDDTPPHWEPQEPQWGSLPADGATTEFPAFPGYGNATGSAPVYGSSADPYEPSHVAYPPQQDPPGYTPQPGYAPGYAGYPGGPGYPGTGWEQPPAPSRRRRTVAWVAGSAVVVAALVVAAVVVFTSSDDSGSGKGGGADTAGRTITLPATAAGYTQDKSFDTNSLKQQLGTALQSSGASGASTQNAQVGVYTQGGSAIPGLIFVAIALKDVPRLSSQADSIGLDAAVRKFVTGASTRSSGSTPKSVPAGTLGGAMYCSTGTISVEPVANCGWGDRSYFALTIVISPTSTDAAAKTTRSFRSAVEH